MPQFRGPVVIYGNITVEAEDMYEADEKAQSMNAEEVFALLLNQRGGLARCDIEVFDKEFPEEV